jgi:hypothetical protein
MQPEWRPSNQRKLSLCKCAASRRGNLVDGMKHSIAVQVLWHVTEEPLQASEACAAMHQLQRLDSHLQAGLCVVAVALDVPCCALLLPGSSAVILQVQRWRLGLKGGVLSKEAAGEDAGGSFHKGRAHLCLSMQWRGSLCKETTQDETVPLHCLRESEDTCESPHMDQRYVRSPLSHLVSSTSEMPAPCVQRSCAAISCTLQVSCSLPACESTSMLASPASIDTTVVSANAAGPSKMVKIAAFTYTSKKTPQMYCLRLP